MLPEVQEAMPKPAAQASTLAWFLSRAMHCEEVMVESLLAVMRVCSTSMLPIL